LTQYSVLFHFQYFLLSILWGPGPNKAKSLLFGGPWAVRKNSPICSDTSDALYLGKIKY
jgi:hypothetical protein